METAGGKTPLSAGMGGRDAEDASPGEGAPGITSRTQDDVTAVTYG